ncbi:MAG: hypothetical protein RL077_3938 [Verrucomicrobiota bacterium]
MGPDSKAEELCAPDGLSWVQRAANRSPLVDFLVFSGSPAALKIVVEPLGSELIKFCAWIEMGMGAGDSVGGRFSLDDVGAWGLLAPDDGRRKCADLGAVGFACVVASVGRGGRTWSLPPGGLGARPFLGLCGW